jgi:hypothetical protein
MWFTIKAHFFYTKTICTKKGKCDRDQVFVCDTCFWHSTGDYEYPVELDHILDIRPVGRLLLAQVRYIGEGFWEHRVMWDDEEMGVGEAVYGEQEARDWALKHFFEMLEQYA